MGTWVEQVHKRAAVFQDQIVAVRHTELSSGIQLGDTIAFLQKRLRDLYEEEMPLAKIYDTSDLVFHAEGPSTATSTPGLHAFNWLCSSAEKQLKTLARNIFELSDRDAKRLSNKLDLRFTGFAPGSIYAGFTLSEIPAPMGLNEPEHVFSALKIAIRQLPAIPEFIEDERVSSGILELIPDPAMRDASLEAVFKLSPSGRAGIHSLDISSPDARISSLTNRERVVLRDALMRPVTLSKKTGKFVGEVREIDLDSGRFHLRNVEGVGTVRCVMPLTSEQGQQLLGSQIVVSGEYECDPSGRPRLMFVSSIGPSKQIDEQVRLSFS
ncbi:hypothetical protein ACIOWK_26770 [Pseudomonas protegens]|uniref:hypothetical protein n=1 Tax=Pseudomonas protegens TaxID=380021 RepID=UPI00382729B9